MAQNPNQSDSAKLPAVAFSPPEPSSDALMKSGCRDRGERFARKIPEISPLWIAPILASAGREVFGLFCRMARVKPRRFVCSGGLCLRPAVFCKWQVNLRTARASAQTSVMSQNLHQHGLLSVMENLTFYGKSVWFGKGNVWYSGIQTVLQQFDLQDSTRPSAVNRREDLSNVWRWRLVCYMSRKCCFLTSRPAAPDPIGNDASFGGESPIYHKTARPSW